MVISNLLLCLRHGPVVEFPGFRAICGIRKAAFSTTTSFAAPAADGRAPVGVARASLDSSDKQARPTLFEHEFSLAGRVALVTGANRGLGLESALALTEAGARAVYCVDIEHEPGTEWLQVRDYVSQVRGEAAGGVFQYVHCDVRDQERMWGIGEMIGDKEGRMDVCVAMAGMTGEAFDCLDVPAAAMQKVQSASLALRANRQSLVWDSPQQVLDVNLSGALYTAQAAGRQMARLNSKGSIVLVGSTAAHVAYPQFKVLPYEASKSGVLQMTRSLACELAPKGIRVNSISPGYIKTPLSVAFLSHPEMMENTAKLSPMGRPGEPHELRGVVVWLASDASSFCTGSDIGINGGQTAW